MASLESICGGAPYRCFLGFGFRISLDIGISTFVIPLAMLSFIVPAHNEELLLGKALAAIHAAARETGADYEVVVVDDASTDGTARIAETGGAQVIPVNYRQIAATRNA